MSQKQDRRSSIRSDIANKGLKSLDKKSIGINSLSLAPPPDPTRKVGLFLNKEKVRNFLNAAWTVAFFTVLTFWILVGDDFRWAFAAKSADPYFFASFFICFALFLLEIALSLYSKDRYMGSFFFYLDLVATISILIDVDWLSFYVFNISKGRGESTLKEVVERISLALRIAARVSRILKFLRVLRMLRFVKVLKNAQVMRKSKKKEEEEATERGKLQQYIIELENSKSKYSAELKSPVRGNRSKQYLEPPTPSPQKESKLTDGKPATEDEINEIIEDLLMYQEELMINEEDQEEQEAKVTLLGKHVMYSVTKILITLMLFIVITVPIFVTGSYRVDYRPQVASVDLLAQ